MILNDGCTDKIVVGDADQNVLCFDQKIKSFDDFVYLGVIMVVVMIKLPFLHQLQTAVVIKMSHHDDQVAMYSSPHINEIRFNQI